VSGMCQGSTKAHPFTPPHLPQALAQYLGMDDTQQMAVHKAASILKWVLVPASSRKDGDVSRLCSPPPVPISRPSPPSREMITRGQRHPSFLSAPSSAAGEPRLPALSLAAPDVLRNGAPPVTETPGGPLHMGAALQDTAVKSGQATITPASNMARSASFPSATGAGATATTGGVRAQAMRLTSGLYTIRQGKEGPNGGEQVSSRRME
jgi:hypothetical protein